MTIHPFVTHRRFRAVPPFPSLSRTCPLLIRRPVDNPCIFRLRDSLNRRSLCLSKGKNDLYLSGLTAWKRMGKFNLIGMAAMPAAASENTRGKLFGVS